MPKMTLVDEEQLAEVLRNAYAALTRPVTHGHKRREVAGEIEDLADDLGIDVDVD